MAGPAWDDPEKLLLIIYERAGSRHSYILEKLQNMGAHRTLDSIRSKIYELKHDKDVFDRIQRKWKEEEVKRLVKELEGERSKEFRKRYKSDE
jgi:hypothetical protein